MTGTRRKADAADPSAGHPLSGLNDPGATPEAQLLLNVTAEVTVVSWGILAALGAGIKLPNAERHPENDNVLLEFFPETAALLKENTAP